MEDKDKLRLEALRKTPRIWENMRAFWELQHLIMLEILEIPGAKAGKRKK